MARGSLKVHFRLFAFKAFFSFPMGWDRMARHCLYPYFPFVHNGLHYVVWPRRLQKTMATTVEMYTLMLLQSGSEGEEEI